MPPPPIRSFFLPANNLAQNCLSQAKLRVLTSVTKGGCLMVSVDILSSSKFPDTTQARLVTRNFLAFRWNIRNPPILFIDTATSQIYVFSLHEAYRRRRHLEP